MGMPCQHPSGGGGGTLIFCRYIGEAPASTPPPPPPPPPKQKKILIFTDHPQKIPVLSGIPKKILELLAYPKKLFIFFMPIDEILSHPYDLSCWWDVKSQKQKEPPQKYRLGTISNTKLLAGLNRFYRILTSPSASQEFCFGLLRS